MTVIMVELCVPWSMGHWFYRSIPHKQSPLSSRLDRYILFDLVFCTDNFTFQTQRDERCGEGFHHNWYSQHQRCVFHGNIMSTKSTVSQNLTWRRPDWYWRVRSWWRFCCSSSRRKRWSLCRRIWWAWWPCSHRTASPPIWTTQRTATAGSTTVQDQTKVLSKQLFVESIWDTMVELLLQPSRDGMEKERAGTSAGTVSAANDNFKINEKKNPRRHHHWLHQGPTPKPTQAI